MLVVTAGSLGAAERLTLAEAVQRAVENYPTVAAARQKGLAIREKEAEARSAYLPRVEYQESWVRSNNPVFVFGALLTQRQFGPQNFAIDSLNRPAALNQFQSLVMAEQMLWDGGRTRKQVESARLGQKIAATEVKQLELALASRTARAYLDAQLAQAGVRLAEQTVGAAEADLRQAEAARDAGRATAADALAVRVHLAAMRENLAMRRADLRIAMRVLADLVGANDTELELVTPMVMKETPAVAAVAQRAELEQGRLTLEARKVGTGLARLYWLPQVSLRAGFEADRQNFVNKAGANWMAGVSLKWRLFDGGADRAPLRAAVSDERAAALQLKAVEQQVAVEVMQAATLVEANQERLETARTAIEAAEESLRITRDRYEAGLENITSLLRMETALAEAQLRLLMARHAVRVAKLNQEAALGKLGPNSEVLQ
jgi:outer membrane protein TolC